MVSQTKIIFLFFSFWRGFTMSYIVYFLANCWTLKRPQKEGEGNQSGSWSNLWKGRVDFAVQSIPSIRQSSLIPQIMFSVLFCTLWCQAQLQQVTELHGIAEYRTTKTQKCLWEVSGMVPHLKKHVCVAIQVVLTLWFQYKREQCLPILLKTFSLLTCILAYTFSRCNSCIFGISFT